MEPQAEMDLGGAGTPDPLFPPFHKKYFGRQTCLNNRE